MPEVAQLLGSRQDVNVGGFAPEFMLLTAAVHGLSSQVSYIHVQLESLLFPGQLYATHKKVAIEYSIVCTIIE